MSHLRLSGVISLVFLDVGDVGIVEVTASQDNVVFGCHCSTIGVNETGFGVPLDVVVFQSVCY